MNNDLLQEVKKETWLFTDEEIINQINEMNNNKSKYRLIDAEYIVLYLYKNKGIISKDEYKIDVMNYLYDRSLDSKDEIDEIILKDLDWFYKYYNETKNNDYYHAVQYARTNLIRLLHY